MKPKATIGGKNNTMVSGNGNNININHYYVPPKPVKPEIKVIQHNPDIHISQEQQAKIQEIIKETYEMMIGYKDNIYTAMFGGLKRKLKLHNIHYCQKSITKMLYIFYI
ncbi:MAG: hypothetical protein LBP54_04805 [Campylobacteraceae bacterium]|jgi:hypothetical protein|nr:hypothetical protein [Campylobacteraceae bacterium]